MLVMIDNYDSFTYNLVQYFYELNCKDMLILKNNEMDLMSLILKYKIDAFVISPGPSRPINSGITNDLVGYAIKNNIPTLGVCLGMQAIGEKLGLSLSHSQNPVHGKISKIYHSQTGLFEGIPSPFNAVRYHSLELCNSNNIQDIIVTAQTENGTIMGISHKALKIYGVQFHPESILTEYGHDMINNFLRIVYKY